MKEAFLHHVWKFQYFDKTDLKTTCGLPVLIKHPGHHNIQDAGPDFEQGKVKIDTLNWVGNIEIHYRSSDWHKHQHHTDLAYDNVILHVVWEDDQNVYRQDGSKIPTLALHNRVAFTLIEKFKHLIESSDTIACATAFQQTDRIIQLSMLDRVLSQRLQRKAEEILELLKLNKMDWEETAYQVLAKNFGFKINSFPFLLLARSLPFKLLKKHGNQLLQLEALLFGQSGLLAKTHISDDYHQQLSKEYQFLAKKYSLTTTQLSVAQWKFLRMRPANFPTIRLAQFATLHHQQKTLFSKILLAQNIANVEALFDIIQSDYWASHYIFGKQSKKEIMGLGKHSIHNLIINTVVPLMVAYGKHKSDQTYIDKGLAFLQELAAESNNITKRWKALNLPITNAFDSQGSIEWYQEYCQQKQCLRCSVGTKLIR